MKRRNTNHTAPFAVIGLLFITVTSSLGMADDSGAGTSQQGKLYEAASEGAKTGVAADYILAGVWTGVAGVCAASCFGALPDGGLCMKTTIGATIGDAIKTKEFAGALATLAPQVMALQQSTQKGVEEAAENAAKKQKGRDWTSCLSAAMAARQVYSKYQSIKSANETSDAAQKSIEKLRGSGPGIEGTPIASGSGGSQSGASGGSERSSGNGGVISAEKAIQAKCAAAKASGNVEQIMECAAASDSHLPSFVKDPKFQDEFKLASGMSLPELINRGAPPAQGLAMSMGGTLTTDTAKGLVAAIQEFGDGTDGTSGVYAGGGGGGGSGGGSGESAPDFGALMQGMLGKLGPQGQATAQRGVNDLAFGQKNRAPASASAEDPRISIFDRVTSRYFVVSKRVMQ